MKLTEDGEIPEKFSSEVASAFSMANSSECALRKSYEKHNCRAQYVKFQHF